MELKVEAGHNRLVQLMKFLRTNQADLDEVVLHFVQFLTLPFRFSDSAFLEESNNLAIR